MSTSIEQHTRGSSERARTPINFKHLIRIGEVAALLGFGAAGGAMLVNRMQDAALATADFRDVVWTKQDGACAVGSDGSRQVLGLNETLQFRNGSVHLIRETYGGTKLGGPIGFAFDTDGDGVADMSSVIHSDGTITCK